MLTSIISLFQFVLTTVGNPNFNLWCAPVDRSDNPLAVRVSVNVYIRIQCKLVINIQAYKLYSLSYNGLSFALLSVCSFDDRKAKKLKKNFTNIMVNPLLLKTCIEWKVSFCAETILVAFVNTYIHNSLFIFATRRIYIQQVYVF